MLTAESSGFAKYVTFLLGVEGKTSKNPDDSAASCAPSPGAVHTNKGVTYCTFRDTAGSLGITPVTYERFLALTDADVAKFVYQYYKYVNGAYFPDSVALSLTEVAWGSGPNTAGITLQRAINSLNPSTPLVVDGSIGPLTVAAAGKIPEKTLYNAFWQERTKWILALTENPKYAMFKNNWIARIHAFVKEFAPTATAAIILLTAAVLLLWINKR